MISIHALVKRATKTPILIKADQNISIHALVKRATTVSFRRGFVFMDFNPRPREEGDFSVKKIGKDFKTFQSTPS